MPSNFENGRFLVHANEHRKQTIFGSGFRFAEPLLTAPVLPLTRFTGSAAAAAATADSEPEPEPEPPVRTSGLNLFDEIGSHSSLNGRGPLPVRTRT